MVRYSFLRRSDNKLPLTDERCNPADTFMSRGAPCRVEVSEVDVDGRRLIPLSGIGDHSVFVGDTHCVMLAADKFPKVVPQKKKKKVAANAVYLNYLFAAPSRLRRLPFRGRGDHAAERPPPGREGVGPWLRRVCFPVWSLKTI